MNQTRKKRLVNQRRRGGTFNPASPAPMPSHAHNQPDLMKVRTNSTPNKNKTCGNDMQKWTLACICYAMGKIRVVG